MHELSIMSSILDIVLEHAEKNGAKKVTKVNLKIGDLSDIIPEWAQSYFDMLSKETIAENAELVIEHVQVRVRCNSCKTERAFERGKWSFLCNTCESNDIELLSGREMSISSIEIE